MSHSSHFEEKQELYDEVVQLTRDMVEIRSVNPPGSEGEMAHQPDEYVEVDSLTGTLDTFLRFFGVS